jgi:hypothetical protein
MRTGRMKKQVLILAMVIVALVAGLEISVFDEPATTTPSIVGKTESNLRSVFESKLSDVQVRGSGEVVKVLSDDNDGSRHQRFILRIASGQTVLVAHNIDLAKRVNGLKAGDRIEFNGEYEWNAKGGVIHWTHRDPQGRHESGWIKHKGRTFE